MVYVLMEFVFARLTGLGLHVTHSTLPSQVVLLLLITWKLKTTGGISISGQQKHLFFVTLKEEGLESATVGVLYLLVAEAYEPTLRNFDFIDIDFTKGFHTLTIPLDNRVGEIDWIIGVYATVFVSKRLDFKLIVWEPPM